jgi:hypothetical protein
MSGAALDYDSLMQANLARVFNERDAARRFEAAAELYWPHLSPDFSFRATGPFRGSGLPARLGDDSTPKSSRPI